MIAEIAAFIMHKLSFDLSLNGRVKLWLLNYPCLFQTGVSKCLTWKREYLPDSRRFNSYFPRRRNHSFWNGSFTIWRTRPGNRLKLVFEFVMEVLVVLLLVLRPVDPVFHSWACSLTLTNWNSNFLDWRLWFLRFFKRNIIPKIICQLDEIIKICFFFFLF